MDKGIVIKSTGSRYRVLPDDGSIIECSIRGKMRINAVRTTNPVAVGDYVLFEKDIKTGTGVITEVLDRKNYILRKSSNLSKQSQILAANIDQVILMITIILPETQPEFIDRFLITAEAYRIPAIILLNKTDLYGDEENEKRSVYEEIYRNIGYKVLSVSVEKDKDLESVKELLKDKVTLVSGNSGVGKTSLLNRLNPSLQLKTGEISEYHKQGRHITTFPEMHPMPFGGYVIDTPGIRGFGVVDMEKNELYHFFPEIFQAAGNCRFYNCLHLDEPGCAVRKAVEEGRISIMRYKSYLGIIDTDESKYR